MIPAFTPGSRQVLVVVLVAALLLPVGVGTVAGQSFQGAAGTVVVEEGTTYEQVDGVAGAIVVRGTVTGDVSGAAGTIHVTETGVVEGNIEAAAGTVRIDGTVEGNVDVGAGTVEVGETARIGGSLQTGAGYVSIDGTIDGDVRAGAETIAVGQNAVIGGEFRYDAANFERHPDATIEGDVIRDRGLSGTFGPGFGVGFDGFQIPTWASVTYGFLANLLLGALLLFAFPRFSTGVADRVAGEPLKSGGVGLLTLVAVPIALVVLLLTVVGVPLAIVGAIAFAFAIWIGVVYGQYAVGAWVLGQLGRDNRWLALVVGLLGFALLGTVQYLGGFLEFIAFLLGFGALALGLRGSYRSRRDEGESTGRQATLDEVAGDS
ncbi:bactofilin family protein [Halalkaliarchaeum desulfuricum]|nr:polymer-forming cytoskeletal protein [Halalkaliarchaeum desulfuricum]